MVDHPTKICSKCSKELPATTEYFSRNKTCKYGVRSCCKHCQGLNSKSYYTENKEKIKVRTKEYRSKNKEKYRAYTKEWQKKNKEKYKAQTLRTRAHRKERFKNDEEYRLDVRQKRKEWNRKLKMEVFCHYSSSSIPSCSCCGETTFEFLSIDHINGCGNDHRRNIKGSNGTGRGREIGGIGFYSRLRMNNYPPGLQVLCYNCNCAKGFFGECPHKRIEREV